MKYITTKKAPAAVGPYSIAIDTNGLLFCSGQIGIDPETNELQEGIENQTHRVMKNITAVLRAADLGLNAVVKTTIFLTDMEHYGRVNEIYGTYFATHKPARTCVAVKALPRNALIEIECIAVSKLS